MKKIDKVALLYWERGRLLCTRSQGKETYYIPGGKREAGETDVETLVRELQEELGVEVRPETARLYGVFQAQAHGKAEGVLVKMTCYTAEFSGTPRPGSEIAELAWLDSSGLERASPVDKLIFADLREKGLLQ